MTKTNTDSSKPIIWSIAGSDSGGGAGIQADLHTIHALGGFACTVITTLTAQNSVTIQDIHYPPASFIAAQLQCLNDDLPPRAIKLGVLGHVDSIKMIGDFLNRYVDRIPMIGDPVMVSTSGCSLMSDEQFKHYTSTILPKLTLLTPNLAEAQLLTQRSLDNEHDIVDAGQQLLQLGPKAVLIKGGHCAIKGEHCTKPIKHTKQTTLTKHTKQTVVTEHTELTSSTEETTHHTVSQDYFTDGRTSYWLRTPRVPHVHNHGSGCTLSAAIATALGLGYSLSDALVIAKMAVQAGIRQAVPYGQGPGPVAHEGWPSDGQDLPEVIQM